MSDTNEQTTTYVPDRGRGVPEPADDFGDDRPAAMPGWQADVWERIRRERIAPRRPGMSLATKVAVVAIAAFMAALIVGVAVVLWLGLI